MAKKNTGSSMIETISRRLTIAGWYKNSLETTGTTFIPDQCFSLSYYNISLSGYDGEGLGRMYPIPNRRLMVASCTKNKKHDGVRIY
jgi:hypothetical protein